MKTLIPHPPSIPAHADRMSRRLSNPSNPKKSPAYILLELIIALSIFAIAVLGLAKSLSSSVEVSNILNRESAIRIGMRSFVEELRKKPLADMTTSVTDPALGVTYSSKVERLGLRTGRGETLADLYDLQVTATFNFEGLEETDTVSVYVYKPNQR
jgi:type II secretory pathway pseudopilin PulG